MNKPDKLETFMYALMKGARRQSLMQFLKDWDISEKEYDDIAEWFEKTFEIKL